jgi:hypothetical protein
MLWLPFRRATLLVPSGPEHDVDRKHLFIVLTDPVDQAGGRSVLMVSLSTLYPDLPHDPTCRLYPGDHPFVTRESYVFYARARIEAADKLLRGVKSRQLIPKDPIESGIFARMCQGLEDSRFTPLKILHFYRQASGRNQSD